jgi:putative DNA methylase
MTYRKKLIEVALPLEAINEASAREKSIRHGHPSTLHLWWARRPLAACRAVIFASLVDDPDDPDAPPEFVEACRKLPRGKNAAENDTPRQRLFDFIETLVQWESTTDEQVLETARRLIRLATDGTPPPLLDPFAGGGSIPLEAQRLGLEAHASDLNPVAVMICKALIEIPPRFADMPPVNPRDRQGTAGDAGWKGATGLAADVRYYGEWMRDRAWERIGHLYPKVRITTELSAELPNLRQQGFRAGDELTVIAWLWARIVKCPNPACGINTPLLTSFVLASKKGREKYLVPKVESRTVSFDVSDKPPQKYSNPRKGLKRGTSGVFECVRCGTVTTRDYVSEEGIAKRIDAIQTAVVLEGNRQRVYLPAQYSLLPKDIPDVDTTGLDIELSPNPRDVWCRNFGLDTPAELFTDRQLVALSTFSGLVAEARQQIITDALTAGLPTDNTPLHDGGTGAHAYAEAVSVYLAFAVDRSADFWGSLAFWANQPKNELVAHVFGRQALPMVWDYAEANPFSSSGGNWLRNLEYVAKSLNNSVYGAIPGKAIQANATELSDYPALVISTDPPYYDNIGYADLSDYFYVWLRSSLRDVYPDVFSTLLVPKTPELVAAAYRFGSDRDAATKHFETGLMQSFSSMRAIIPVDYPLSVYYAFKQQEIIAEEGTASTGWETMLNSLIETGFSIVGTWPMRTERSGRMVASGTNVLASSIVLVCRPRSMNAPITSRREFVNALRRELPAALREMQTGNIAPVDLAQASIGPGMAVYSRYSKVLEPNGDRLTVRTALQLINHELDAYLAEQEGYIDEDSRFAVAWFEQFGFQEGPFGQADVLARAKNTSVDGLAYAGVLESGAGKVRLYHWSELDAGWDPATDKRRTVWEATHHLIERLNVYGEEGAARLLAKMPPDLAAEARQLAYRLYSICDRKGWAEHARDYNALVISWGASQEQAREFKEQYQQGKLF